MPQKRAPFPQTPKTSSARKRPRSNASHINRSELEAELYAELNETITNGRSQDSKRSALSYLIGLIDVHTHERTRLGALKQSAFISLMRANKQNYANLIISCLNSHQYLLAYVVTYRFILLRDQHDEISQAAYTSIILNLANLKGSNLEQLDAKGLFLSGVIDYEAPADPIDFVHLEKQIFQNIFSLKPESPEDNVPYHNAIRSILRWFYIQWQQQVYPDILPNRESPAKQNPDFIAQALIGLDNPLNLFRNCQLLPTVFCGSTDSSIKLRERVERSKLQLSQVDILQLSEYVIEYVTKNQGNGTTPPEIMVALQHIGTFVFRFKQLSLNPGLFSALSKISELQANQILPIGYNDDNTHRFAQNKFDNYDDNCNIMDSLLHNNGLMSTLEPATFRLYLNKIMLRFSAIPPKTLTPLILSLKNRLARVQNIKAGAIFRQCWRAYLLTHPQRAMVVPQFLEQNAASPKYAIDLTDDSLENPKAQGPLVKVERLSAAFWANQANIHGLPEKLSKEEIDVIESAARAQASEVLDIN